MRRGILARMPPILSTPETCASSCAHRSAGTPTARIALLFARGSLCPDCGQRVGLPRGARWLVLTPTIAAAVLTTLAAVSGLHGPALHGLGAALMGVASIFTVFVGWPRVRGLPLTCA